MVKRDNKESMKSFLFKLMTCVLAGAVAQPNFSRAATCLSTELGIDEFYTKARLSETDVAEIKMLFAEGRPYEEALDLAFDAYVEIRLREFSPIERQQIMRSLNRLKIESDNFKFLANASRIVIPKILKDSVYLKGIMAHEFEHIIQIQKKIMRKANGGRIRRSYLATIKVFSSILFNAEHLYSMEVGAMRAEWEFIQLVPSTFFESKRYDNIVSYFPAETQRTLKGFKTNRNLNLAEYIKLQHSQNRYSRANVKKDQAFRRRAVFSAVTWVSLALVLVSAGLLSKVCREHKKIENPLLRNMCPEN